MSTNKHG